MKNDSLIETFCLKLSPQKRWKNFLYFFLSMHKTEFMLTSECVCTDFYAQFILLEPILQLSQLRK